MSAQYGEEMSTFVDGLRLGCTALTTLQEKNTKELDKMKMSMGIAATQEAAPTPTPEQLVALVQSLGLPMEQVEALNGMSVDAQAKFLSAGAEEQQSALGFSLPPALSATAKGNLAKGNLLQSAAQSLPSSSTAAFGAAGSSDFSSSLPALSSAESPSAPASGESEDGIKSVLSAMDITEEQKQTIDSLSPGERNRFISLTAEQQQGDLGFSLPPAAAEALSGGASADVAVAKSNRMSIPKEALMGIGGQSNRKGSVSLGQFVRRSSLQGSPAAGVAMAAQAFAGGMGDATRRTSSAKELGVEMAKEMGRSKFLAKIGRRPSVHQHQMEAEDADEGT
jgi:hypothetical protein